MPREERSGSFEREHEAIAMEACPSQRGCVEAQQHGAPFQQGLCRRPAFRALLAHQTFKQCKILLIAIRRKIERGRDPDKRFFLDVALVLLHEALIDPPRHARSFHGVPFRPYGDLVRMEIVEAQFVEQSLFDDLVR